MRDNTPSNAPSRSLLLAGLENLSPAYFGMVMATGIVSLSAWFLGHPLLAQSLFGLNLVLYSIFALLFMLRLWRHPREFFADMVDHLRGPGYFTTVAGTSILGSQFVVLAGHFSFAWVLWFTALILWILLTYTIFAVLTIKEEKPTLDRGISGGWLLAVVATQSIAVLAALLSVDVEQPLRQEMNFLALSMWLWGGMLYIWMMSLIFYRYTFFRFSPDDLSPPYWINMGAMAISTLAGSLLIGNTDHAPFLHSLLPFLKGFTVFYWATGTWWIPMLLVLAIWRHGYKRFPLRYDPLYWGAVFPLGMYAACTHKLAGAMGFHFLDGIAPVFLWIAGLAWSTAFYGFLHSLWRRKSTST